MHFASLGLQGRLGLFELKLLWHHVFCEIDDDIYVGFLKAPIEFSSFMLDEICVQDS